MLQLLHARRQRNVENLGILTRQKPDTLRSVRENPDAAAALGDALAAAQRLLGDQVFAGEGPAQNRRDRVDRRNGDVQRVAQPSRERPFAARLVDVRQAAALRLEADVERDIAGQTEIRLDLLAARQFAEVDVAAARQTAAGGDLALDDDV